MKLNGLSLFSNIGVAEAYLEDLDVNIKVANELLPERARLYSAIYPNVKMVCGDITDKTVFNDITAQAKKNNVDFIIATPPCQGMSTAGKKDDSDKRNYLIQYAIDMILKIKPRYVLLENVPRQLNTRIDINGKKVLIPDYIKDSLSDFYNIKIDVVNALDYGVPQMRMRSIILCSLKSEPIQWDFPTEKTPHLTLKDVIGHLPPLDPYIQGFTKNQMIEHFPDFYSKKENGLKVSKWHFPPTHKIRHIIAMEHTPEGKSALENERFYPAKPDGTKVKGFANTYKRQSWDKPAYTITTYNGAICSQDNVHPGRSLGKDKNGNMIYSDARVFSIYELLILMSLPTNWGIPDNTNENLIRHTIGEGVPPLIIKTLVEQLVKEV